MQLSRRLQAVTDMVNRGNCVADIGCDHAYTSIYLASNSIASKVFAMDINQGPVDRAKENVKRYHLEDRIEVRKSDGLQMLQPEEVDTIIMAGMGGALMIEILQQRMEIVRGVSELILQPQSEHYKVREFLEAQEFIIFQENMLKEDGKYYVIIKSVPGSAVKGIQLESYKLVEPAHYHYGRLLLEAENNILREYLLWDMELCMQIKASLREGNSNGVQQRLTEIEDKMMLIQRGLSYFKIPQ